jgi:TIR domain
LLINEHSVSSSCLLFSSMLYRGGDQPANERSDMAFKIFISYRRSDSVATSRAIYDYLAARFGAENVFLDIQSIPLGETYPIVLNDAINHCEILLLVIGPQWATAQDEAGHRRLLNSDDIARGEVETAIARGIPIIPAIIDGANMPDAAGLPPSIQQISHLHGNPVRVGPTFAGDMQRVVDAILKRRK